MSDPAHIQSHTTTEDQVMPAVAYGLFLLGLATGGLTSIVGLIIAYAQRDSAGWRNRSHYDFLIRTFWLTLVGAVALAVIGGILMLVGIPLVALGGLSWVALGLIGVWYAVRCIVGVIFLARAEAYPRPQTWLI